MIDRNFYPVKEAENSKLRHRPVGLGVQGLADAFIMLRLPFTSEEEAAQSRHFRDFLYYAAVTASAEEAKNDGPYQTFKGFQYQKEN